MKKSDLPFVPDYYGIYINQLEDKDLLEILSDSLQQLKSLNGNILEKLHQKKYRSDKWSLNDLLQHLIDTERILNYRALLLSREDNPTIPGFDQDQYSKMVNADKRRIADLLDELIEIRASTISLYRSFDDNILLREGTCWNYRVTVLSIGLMTAGHQLHHFRIIEEKYLPLLS